MDDGEVPEMSSDPCDHLWAYQGLVYWHDKHPRPGSSAHDRLYADRYFCQRCLATHDKNARVEGHSYQKPLPGALPR